MEKLVEKKVKVELTLGEIYNIHMALINRNATVSALWSNAVDNDTREKYEVMVKAIGAMDKKFTDILDKEGK